MPSDRCYLVWYNVSKIHEMLSKCQKLHTQKSVKKGHFLRRFCWIDVRPFKSSRVKFEKFTCRVRKLLVWIWWKLYVEKCAISGQNGLFCHPQIAKWQVGIKWLSCGGSSNVLRQSQLRNRLRFKAMFLLGGRKTRSKAKEAILTRSGKIRL